jgi:hypothetical protein
MGMRLMRAQGATEYLVLLAVVLIVALVSVALLGFFPGMASDAQLTQSQTYWKGASPISVVETAADGYDYRTFPYIRVRNNGAYPIRITKLLAADTQSISQVYIGSYASIQDYYYLAPGEEKYFARMASFSGLSTSYEIDVQAIGCSSSGIALCGAKALCNANAAATENPGSLLNIKNFGFEYIEYFDNGQQITKREVGKDLLIKCTS